MAAGRSRYCSADCAHGAVLSQERDHHERMRAARRGVRRCAICAAVLGYRRKRYCSDWCLGEGRRRLKAGYRAARRAGERGEGEDAVRP